MVAWRGGHLGGSCLQTAPHPLRWLAAAWACGGGGYLRSYSINIHDDTPAAFLRASMAHVYPCRMPTGAIPEYLGKNGVSPLGVGKM